LNRKLYFIRANRNKFGGAENYLSRLSIALNKQNINYQVVNSVFPRFLPSWLRAILFNFQVSFLKKDKFYFSLDRITCPDIYRAGDGVHKAFLKVENKSKLNPLHPVYLYLEKRCFNNAKCIIANSNMIKNEIVSTYEIKSNKVRVVYNGIENKKINYSKSFRKISKEFNIDKNTQILLYVGSGFKRKGVLEFLQVVEKLKSYDIKAFIVGKDKNIRYYQQLAKEFNIDKKVIFTGPREDVDDFYTISDIFILPTHYEPFSNVILEAMNFKNVVFTTRQNGASEILNPEYMAESPNDLSIVPTIKKLLSDKNKLEEEKVTNRETSKKFSIERNLKESLKIISMVVNNS
jgi:UDP-glucose:(heptosyl)LPS alpha-1,3-glucosyltransferase